MGLWLATFFVFDGGWVLGVEKIWLSLFASTGGEMYLFYLAVKTTSTKYKKHILLSARGFIIFSWFYNVCFGLLSCMIRYQYDSCT